MRKLLVLLFLLVASPAFAGSTFNPFTGKPDKIPTIQEEDGDPAIQNCMTIKFPNANVTDNGDGTCSIADQTGAGGGDEITVNTTAATNANFLDNPYIDWTLVTASTPDDITAKYNYAETLAGDPALLVDECIFAKDTSGGFFLCEGSTADTAEQAYRFPDLNGSDTTEYILVTTTADKVGDAQIADGAVDGGAGGEIADGSVTADDLGTDSVSADELNATGVETELEAVLDLDQLQGQIGDAQIADGAVDGGTGGEIADNSITPADIDETQDFTYTTLSGKQDRNNTAVNDDDCTGEQGLWWYDTTDSAFEWCNANSGAPVTLTGGSDTLAPQEIFWALPGTLPLEAAADSIPPITKDAGTNIDQLPIAFDDSTDECRTVVFQVTSKVDTSGTVTFNVWWYSAAATSGNVIFEIRHNGGVAEGTDPDQALTTVAAAADATQGTAGQITKTSWTETVSNLAWAAGDLVEAQFCRDANNGSDSLVGDQLIVLGFVSVPRTP